LPASTRTTRRSCACARRTRRPTFTVSTRNCAAIAQLGHSLGAALDVLAAKHDDPRDAILDELRSLREMLLRPGQGG
jgi:hypothetical protein